MERLLADAEKIAGVEFDISSYADVVEAIHVIQTEMGITGTTAKEAGTTIQGSVNSMKAAWANLVTGLGDENANIEQLFDDLVVTITGDGTETNLGVMGTVVPRIKVIFGKVTEAIKNKLDEVDWAVEGKKLMTLIGNGIETGIAIMSDIGAKIKEKIDSTDWKQLGKDIATFIKEEIIDTLANIDWEMILDTMRTNYRKNIRANIEVWGGMMDTDVSAALEAFDKMDGGYSDTYTSSSGDTHGGGSIGGGGVRDVNINIYGNTEQTLDQIKKGGQEAAAMLGAQ